jgi:hypothetical protein
MSGFQFGIDKDTKQNNRVIIDVPFKDEVSGKWTFPLAILRKVEYDPKYETKKGERKVLKFHFSDTKGQKTFTHIEWDFDPETDPKAEKKVEALNIRLKHIYTTYAKFPESGIGSKAKSFDGFFKAVEKAFNEDNDGKPIYRTEDSYKLAFIKVVWNNGNRVLPYAPNFLEFTTGQDKFPKTLEVNEKYDDVSNKTASTDFAGGSNIAANMAATDLGNMPEFD